MGSVAWPVAWLAGWLLLRSSPCQVSPASLMQRGHGWQAGGVPRSGWLVHELALVRWYLYIFLFKRSLFIFIYLRRSLPLPMAKVKTVWRFVIYSHIHNTVHD